MLPHYLAKFRSSNFGISERKCKRKCNVYWFLNTHPILMQLASLLTCCFNFRFLLSILCKQQTILSKQLMWTEASFSACLTWRSPDHHWQCNWRVAWTSSRMYAGKRRTLRATIVTIFSKRHFRVFLSNLIRFLDCFFLKLPQIRTSKFRKVVRQHTEGVVGSIVWI